MLLAGMGSGGANQRTEQAFLASTGLAAPDPNVDAFGRA
jgi:hypothetical protein